MQPAYSTSTSFGPPRHGLANTKAVRKLYVHHAAATECTCEATHSTACWQPPSSAECIPRNSRFRTTQLGRTLCTRASMQTPADSASGGHISADIKVTPPRHVPPLPACLCTNESLCIPTLYTKATPSSQVSVWWTQPPFLIKTGRPHTRANTGKRGRGSLASRQQAPGDLACCTHCCPTMVSQAR